MMIVDHGYDDETRDCPMCEESIPVLTADAFVNDDLGVLDKENSYSTYVFGVCEHCKHEFLDLF